MRFTILLMVLVVASTMTTQCQMEPTVNKLEFNTSFEKVADSIYRMEELLKKFPHTNMINYFVGYDGYLYLNNERIAPIAGAINNAKVRKDMVFEEFRNEEIDEFFFLMAFLMKNGIESSHLEPTIGTFSYSLELGEGNKKTERFIMVVDEPSDTTSIYFNKLYKVIDRKGKLFLMGIK